MLHGYEISVPFVTPSFPLAANIVTFKTPSSKSITISYRAVLVSEIVPRNYVMVPHGTPVRKIKECSSG